VARVEVKRKEMWTFIGESEGKDHWKYPGLGESVLFIRVLRG